jgi:hypothetical protein
MRIAANVGARQPENFLNASLPLARGGILPFRQSPIGVEPVAGMDDLGGRWLHGQQPLCYVLGRHLGMVLEVHLSPNPHRVGNVVLAAPAIARLLECLFVLPQLRHRSIQRAPGMVIVLEKSLQLFLAANELMMNPPALHIGERGQKHRLPVWRKGAEQVQSIPQKGGGAFAPRPDQNGISSFSCSSSEVVAADVSAFGALPIRGKVGVFTQPIRSSRCWKPLTSSFTTG